MLLADHTTNKGIFPSCIALKWHCNWMVHFEQNQRNPHCRVGHHLEAFRPANITLVTLVWCWNISFWSMFWRIQYSMLSKCAESFNTLVTQHVGSSSVVMLPLLENLDWVVLGSKHLVNSGEYHPSNPLASVVSDHKEWVYIPSHTEIFRAIELCGMPYMCM